MRILIAEDDPSVAGALRSVVEAHGHAGRVVARGGDLLRRHREAELVLLDLGLADGDGLEALRLLRQVSEVPVIIVSARGDERSTVRGLHLGADDYLVKPVRMNELIARIEVAARRVRDRAPLRVLVAGDVVIDVAARLVTVAGKAVALTAREFALLQSLAKRPNEAVRRELVMDEVLGDACVRTSRAVDVHLAHLRAKLGRPGLITTLHGFGYRLEA